MEEIKLPPLREFLFSLCGVMSVSGFEERGQAALRSMLEPYFDGMETDAVGNHLFWKRSGKPNAPTVVVDAHFDEIGLLVTEVLEGGFLRVAPVGGLDPSILQASDVVIYGKEILRGVIVSIPPHLRSAKDKEKLPSAEEVMVDTGWQGDIAALRETVPVGTPIGFAPAYSVLSGGVHGERSVAGKSFDNKACGAAAAYALAAIPNESLAADVCLLFSSYEETNRLGGVASAMYRIKPDYAMVIDVNLARVPDAPRAETVPFGKGISISVSAATDRRLTRMTRTLCEEEQIPFSTVAAPSSTGTNAATVNLVGAGVPVVDVGLPLKNMHTYNEIISMKDVSALCDLVRAFVCSRTLAEAFAPSEKEVR